MSDERLCWTPATELAALIRKKKVSPVEVLDTVLERIERLNPKLNAFVTLTDEQARREAKAAERALSKKGARLGPLHGVPFSVKDLVITKGVRTTFGTPLYRDNVPSEDAPMVERLKAAGAIMLGKTNTPTFGWIGATHNLLFGPTRNPWNLGRTPGGSSGGASAAAAAGLGPLHVGTDGGGSIRIPASFAGIYGLKASFGRIPAYPPSGAWSLSHIGPMTRTVADAALMLQVAAGPDERDQTSLPAAPVDYVKALAGGVKGLRVAWSADLGFADVVDPEVRDLCAKGASAFREVGCRVEAVDPGWPSPLDCWSQLFGGGIATRMAPYLDRKSEIDPGLYRIIETTLKNPPTKYVQAWFDRLAWWEHPRRRSSGSAPGRATDRRSGRRPLGHGAAPVHRGGRAARPLRGAAQGAREREGRGGDPRPARRPAASPRGARGGRETAVWPPRPIARGRRGPRARLDGRPPALRSRRRSP